MPSFYNLIRPLIVKGDIQNKDSVSNQAVVREALELESGKYSNLVIMNYFYRELQKLIVVATSSRLVQTALDVGSATGEIISRIAAENPKISFKAIDIMQEAVSLSQQKFFNLKNLSFQKQDFIHDEIDRPFDLVLCLQTLEHIEDHFIGYFCERMFDVSRNAVIVSVPREPYWCLANILRFKYWSRLGNTPHHIQHWTGRSFKRLISASAKRKWGPQVEIISVCPLNLWTIILLINHN